MTLRGRSGPIGGSAPAPKGAGSCEKAVDIWKFVDIWKSENTWKFRGNLDLLKYEVEELARLQHEALLEATSIALYLTSFECVRGGLKYRPHN